MDTNRILTGIEKLLSILHCAILFLAALTFTFVFIINWENWFFGTRLAGPLAGLFLAAQAAGAVILLFLVTQYPQHWKTVLPASIAYFGFLFANAMVTFQTTAEPGSFPALLAVLVAIPVLLLIVALITGKPGTGSVSYPAEDHEAIHSERGKRSFVHPLLLLLGGIVFLMIGYTFILPMGIAMVITHVPFFHQMVLPPAKDTVLVKTDSVGNREWTIIIPGYSLDFVRLEESDDGAYFLFGTYWTPWQDEAQIRVLKIDRSGSLIWDMTRSMQFGKGPEGTAQIMGVEPSGPGATVWLTNGMSLTLDRNGAVTSIADPADSPPQPETEMRLPPRYSASQLPADTATILIAAEGKQDRRIIVEDILTRKEINSIYSVNPTTDGGYLVSASVNT